MGMLLTDEQVADYHRDGFLVLPDFADAESCRALKSRAERILADFDPESHRSVFTTNEQTRHADREFIESANGIHCFFEEEAFDSDGRLRQAKELSVNKIGHAMHDLDDVFADFTYTDALAKVAADIGMPDALALQSMYICKQPRIGGEVGCHQDATFLYTDPITVTGSGSRSRTRLSRTGASGRCPADTARPCARSSCATKRTMAPLRRRRSITVARRARRSRSARGESRHDGGAAWLAPPLERREPQRQESARVLGALHLGIGRLSDVELAPALE